MKSYEDMAREVLENRDRILAQRRRKRRIIGRCAALASGACAVVLLSVSLIGRHDLMKPFPDKEPVTTTTTSAESTLPCSTSTAAQVTNAPGTTVTTADTPVTSAIAPQTTAAPRTSAATRVTVTTKIQVTETAQVTVTTTEGHFSPGFPPTTTTPVSEKPNEKPIEPPVTTGSDEGGGGMPVIPWEQRPYEVQYDTLFFTTGVYHSVSMGRELPGELIGECFGEGTLCGYDEVNFKAYNTAGTAYSVDDLPAEEVIAVQGLGRNDFFLFFRNDVTSERRAEILRTIF